MDQQIITCLVNKKNSSNFILLEEYSSGICSVINPKGEILHVGINLFEEEPLLVEEKDGLSYFSSNQIEVYKNYLTQLEDREKKLESMRVQKSKVDQAIDDYKKSVKKSSGTSKRSSYRSSKISLGSGGIVASWNSSKLTFYKHKIEPLSPLQKFSINIEGVGKFICSKKDFLSNFNEVVISSQYKNDGLYTFSTIPEKAMKFIEESSSNNSSLNPNS